MNMKRIIAGLFALICLSNSLFAQIQPGRAIEILVTGVPAEEKININGTYPVSDSGMINMSYIGQVRAAGLRSDHLASSLESRYKAAKIFRNPTFQVIDNDGKRVAEQIVSVGGFVRAAGAKPYNRNLTLVQAINNAGGPTEFGSMKRVRLTRGGKMVEYDCTKSKNQQIPLEPDDTIEVPQKGPLGG
jgi:protein involved in polysaccharide export with SLBB domain